MFILQKAVLFLAKFHKQHHTTHDRSFHLHGDDKSHYKMKMNGVLVKKKCREQEVLIQDDFRFDDAKFMNKVLKNFEGILLKGFFFLLVFLVFQQYFSIFLSTESLIFYG